MSEESIHTKNPMHIDIEATDDGQVKMIVSVSVEDGRTFKIISKMSEAQAAVLEQRLQNAFDELEQRRRQLAGKS